MKLKERFNSLEPNRKKIVIWSLVGIVILLITISGYNSRSKKIQNVTENQGSKSIQLEPDLIQKTMLREQRRKLEELSKKIEDIQKKQNHPQSIAEQKNKEKLPEIPTAEDVAKKSAMQPPPLKKEQKVQEWPLPLPVGKSAGSTPPPPGEPQMIGDITVLSNPVATSPENTDKKKGRTVYLPPSFMEAKLLTGFDASTSGKGRSNPEPLLLRIQTPAVLPNDIKAELEGCFVIAEAVGRLDKERADVRLVSLSCLSNEGKAVIDTPIKGFVTDSDSKVGLSGRVVSRMGAAAARAVVAGFFGGMGDMLKATAT
ncbi:MAG TPA: conjugal transfer protein TraB, partial [Desulfobulbaceae bacterium]|nr:conjugal transfer protein TraB [Desulfobulbaceae bacterium]